ncbi:MAG: hypothetical protein EOP00_04205 [Pedobacter sp.]|nr:MAG: hypothetical protein EOP00_04205 [Pedobacter sp.]
MLPKVTLQISLAPSDFRHVIHLLPHQINVFENQVDEILLTYDVHKSNGHFANNWEKNNAKMWDFLSKISSENPKIRLIKIDYSKEKNKSIASYFFRKKAIPPKDWRGGPFYTYFYGIYEAKNDFVLHIDSDIFFGGLSQTWLNEAINLYQEDKGVLFINPLAGPPKDDKTLVNQVYTNYMGKDFYFKFISMSTRIYLVNRLKLKQTPLKNIRVYNLKKFAKALVRKNPQFKLPEEILTKLMQDESLFRLDFKGEEPGLWSLHPPYRTEAFYKDLPEIIKQIEINDVPEAQKGFYDIVDEFVDWSIAKEKLRN